MNEVYKNYIEYKNNFQLQSNHYTEYIPIHKSARRNTDTMLKMVTIKKIVNNIN